MTVYIFGSTEGLPCSTRMSFPRRTVVVATLLQTVSLACCEYTPAFRYGCNDILDPLDCSVAGKQGTALAGSQFAVRGQQCTAVS